MKKLKRVCLLALWLLVASNAGTWSYGLEVPRFPIVPLELFVEHRAQELAYRLLTEPCCFVSSGEPIAYSRNEIVN